MLETGPCSPPPVGGHGINTATLADSGWAGLLGWVPPFPGRKASGGFEQGTRRQLEITF